ncbi:MAG: hypothetical protein VB029_07070 [Anaerolineaceae bacterium]|nr:hypothetical protein [Anaerolineaceae bacterium]
MESIKSNTWTGKKPVGKREETIDVLEKLSWTVQPPLGLVVGDYHFAENHFAPHFVGDSGYHGKLEVVTDSKKILHVEFNEDTAPSYYKQMFQNIAKRRSGFCFYQATKARTAQTLKVLNNGLTSVEQQMIAENRLTGEFDLVVGASNSVRRSFLILAETIASSLDKPSGSRYYGYAQNFGGGITGWLQVVVTNNKIVQCFYDEIFADTQEEISDESLQQYYRQSKYYCLEYEPAYPDGFNTTFDLLEQKVIASQDLLDIQGLPWTTDTGSRKRNPEYDNYLRLATVIQAEVTKDGLS